MSNQEPDIFYEHGSLFQIVTHNAAAFKTRTSNYNSALGCHKCTSISREDLKRGDSANPAPKTTNNRTKPAKSDTVSRNMIKREAAFACALCQHANGERSRSLQHYNAQRRRQ
ncbi:hypothetical protein JOB18_024417 [Solea senegalensis]|uniref:Uncharacterized protein n=1 Tax=Solea senegalensis TaxID=28829 RepID=A0AAV6Q5S6_SOLSE|nr:hypothetical protein JOB18_024417 [Solea senegalensis]